MGWPPLIHCFILKAKHWYDFQLCFFILGLHQSTFAWCEVSLFAGLMLKLMIWSLEEPQNPPKRRGFFWLAEPAKQRPSESSEQKLPLLEQLPPPQVHKSINTFLRISPALSAASGARLTFTISRWAHTAHKMFLRANYHGRHINAMSFFWVRRDWNEDSH